MPRKECRKRVRWAALVRCERKLSAREKWLKSRLLSILIYFKESKPPPNENGK
jgi:hypothetical protein